MNENIRRISFIEWSFNANSEISLAMPWREQVNLQWDDDEFRFVIDHHAEFAFYSASSLKQQSTVSLHLDTLFWFRVNQSLLFLLNAAYLSEKQQIPIV